MEDNFQNPLVTIASLTYNHAPFIDKCIEGFLMQKVNFNYEIIIHDDASTDGTQEILKQFQTKYPDKIKLILREENVFSMGVTKILYHNIIKKSKAKYIAICEGDDYWIDEYKLQKQVDFLEQNMDYDFSMSRVKKYYEDSKILEDKVEDENILKKPFLKITDYLKCICSQTSTFVFRNKEFNLPHICNFYIGEDILLVAMATKHSKIKLHNEYFSVYRIHKNGMTQQVYNPQLHYSGIYNIPESLNIILDFKYRKLIKNIKYSLLFFYKLNTTKNFFIKFVYKLLIVINFKIKKWLI